MTNKKSTKLINCKGSEAGVIRECRRPFHLKSSNGGLQWIKQAREAKYVSLGQSVLNRSIECDLYSIKQLCCVASREPLDNSFGDGKRPLLYA